MNKKQKRIIANFIFIIIITIAAVVGMINFKDYVNKSEAIQAVDQLGTIILKYRKEHKSVPPESFVNDVLETVPGQVRLGDLRYRGKWIDFAADPNTILAYTHKKYNSAFISSGYVVLRLNGTVEWVNSKDFEKLFNEQKNPYEESLKK